MLSFILIPAAINPCINIVLIMMHLLQNVQAKLLKAAVGTTESERKQLRTSFKPNQRDVPPSLCGVAFHTPVIDRHDGFPKPKRVVRKCTL
jgi:hypothetical protein